MVKAIIIEAGAEIVPPRVEQLERDLRAYQAVVGGLIDVITAGDLMFVFHEEGKVFHEPFNPLATAYLFRVAPQWAGHDFLVGTVFLVGNAGDSFGDVPDRAVRDLVAN